MSAQVSTVFTAFTTNVSLLLPPSCRFVRLTWVRRLGKRRYNIKLWKTFTDCFNCLPIAAIIDEKIFTMHGGLSPDLQSMEQIRRVMRPTDVPDTGQSLTPTRQTCLLANHHLITSPWSLLWKHDAPSFLWFFLFDYES